MTRKFRRLKSEKAMKETVVYSDSKEDKSPYGSVDGRSPSGSVDEEEDRAGSARARVSMVRGDPDDGVARNLLPEIEEEAKEESPAPAVESETPAGSPMVDAPPIVIDLTEAERAEPQTPATRAMNAFPPQFPPDWIPARALELLTAKNDVLKCLRVTKVSPSGEVRDPGFALMNAPHQLVAAIIGVFNTGGCSVVAADYERILRFPVETLRAAGQATYDLFLRHQAWKLITAAAKSSLHGLVDGSDLKKLAEKYMGHSKEDVVEM